MRRVWMTDVGTVDARAWPALTAGLLSTKEPRLVCARLDGAAIALGRWQDPEGTLSPEGLEKKPIRRLTGGRAIALGEGLRAVALALPHRSFLESEEPNSLPAQRFLNRAVRVLLSGLARRGVPATYGGRDFVTVDGAQAAYVSFDILPEGGALFEAVLPAESHWWLSGEFLRVQPKPADRGNPGPGMIRGLSGCSPAALLDAVGSGLRERFGLETSVSDAPIPQGQVPEWTPLAKRAKSVEIPIGQASASVSMADGKIAEARVSGDFLADSGGIELLSRRLAGCAPTTEAVGAAIDSVFSHPSHTVLGVDDLSTFARSIVQAAEGA